MKDLHRNTEWKNNMKTNKNLKVPKQIYNLTS